MKPDDEKDDLMPDDEIPQGIFEDAIQASDPNTLMERNQKLIDAWGGEKGSGSGGYGSMMSRGLMGSGTFTRAELRRGYRILKG